ncbi:MAG: hypothetical protein ABIR78_02905 [Ferruginibacter sp.]
MQTATLKFLLILVCFIFFIGCQKEISIENGGGSTPIVTNTDSIYLDKIYALDNNGNRVDSIMITYDNQKRVISMGFNTVSPDVYMYNYFYNGADTIPFKSRLIQVSSGSSDTTTTYHYYNSNQRNIKDSAITSRLDGGPFGSYWLYTEIVRYNYAVGKRYAYTDFIFMSPTPGSSVREDTAVVDNENNITSSKAYFSGSGLQNTSDLTFDTHINPFRLLSNFKAHQRFPSGETLFFEYFPYNNILSLREVNHGSPVNITKYTYTYKPNGLPETALITFNSTPPDTTRFLYRYRKL